MSKISVHAANYIRAILTDTLPYETPLFFSNEKMYHELSRAIPYEGLAFAKDLLDHTDETRPFKYAVHKGGGAQRNLAIPHPAFQRKVASFYELFDGFILNSCSRSKYSLRHPSRVGRRYFNSQFAADDEPNFQFNPDPDPTSFNTERRWASTYFSYRNFTQMHQFYASADFALLEQRYEMLLQIDVSKCFESIYTHSIAWSIRGKDFAKQNKDNKRLFEARFDELMQRGNWNETNGIIVGPEISRIFAEIILQQIDVAIERELTAIGVRVAVKRYIDDYLIFGNSQTDLERCKSVVAARLREYNLHLNESKEKFSTRPIVSSLTISRRLIFSELGVFFERIRQILKAPNERLYFQRNASERIISRIRDICKMQGVTYANIASPALAVIARELGRLRQKTTSELPESLILSSHSILIEIVKLAHFVALMDIRMSTSNKLAKIYYEIDKIASILSIGRSAIHSQMMDGMDRLLEQSTDLRIAGPEIVNIVVAIDSIMPKLVTPLHLSKALWAGKRDYADLREANYFDLVAILYFGRNKRPFRNHVKDAINEIERRISLVGKNLKRHTVETMLLFDFVSCPYVNIDRKIALLETVCNVVQGSRPNPVQLNEIAQKMGKRLGFVDWGGPNHLRSLLARKELQPAYD